MTEARTEEDAARPTARGILVVDDDEDFTESLRIMLEDDGYLVSSAANGREALTLLSKFGPPCLIVVDLVMPVMNGTEFLKQLRQNEALALVPVVVVSAWPQETTKLSADVQGFFRKPVELSELMAFIGKYCRTLGR